MTADETRPTDDETRPTDQDRARRALLCVWQQDQSMRRATGQQCQTYEEWFEERARRALGFNMVTSHQ